MSSNEPPRRARAAGAPADAPGRPTEPRSEPRARDLQKAVGSGDGAWFASSDTLGRGTLRSADGASAGPDALAQFIPTVFLYDAYPGGIGLSEPLFGRRTELLAQARTLVEACACRAGCPACIGPVLAADESRTTTPKQLALRVLRLLAAR